MIFFDNGETFMKTCDSCGGLHDGRYASCGPCINAETLQTILVHHFKVPAKQAKDLVEILDEKGITMMLESFAEKETLGL